MRAKPVQSLLIYGVAMSVAFNPAAGQNLPAPSVPNQNLGININQVYDGDQENVNLATGNLYIELYPVKLPGRDGHDLDISLGYNSQIWRLVPSVQIIPNSDGSTGTLTNWNWRTSTDH